jgi:hypothetical protein
MFDLFDDIFHFFTSDVPAAAADAAEEGSDAVEETAHTVFNSWQDTTNDFFHQLNNAAHAWGDPAPSFVSAWQEATQSFADQYAHWWGWDDSSPV